MSDRTAAAARAGDAIAAEAALWTVRTAGKRAVGDRDLGLERWLAEHPGHRAAFDASTSVWQDLGTVARRHPAPAARPAWRPIAAPHRVAWAMALAACLVLAIGIGRWAMVGDPVYATEVGEQRSIRLADATKVMLNTDTRLEVDYDDATRRVVLERGEALFEVAHNPARPFYVEAGGDYVRAVGTSFTVRRDARGVEVTLLEGKVVVGRVGDTRPPDITLVPGDRLRLGGGAAPAIDRPVLDDVTAWRRGQLVFNATPVPAAIAEMNRYSSRHITIRGDSMAQARLSGVFETGESETFVQTLAQIYGVSASRTPDGYVLSGKATQPAR